MDMRPFLRTCLCLLLLTCIALPVTALADGPERGKTVFSLRDGGDVLRPERMSESDYVWYIGIDAGLTYSRFQNGPVYYIIPHPYVPELPWFANANEGSGLGLTAGLTLDFPLSEMFGLVLKGYYHTRAGSFEEQLDVGLTFDPDIPTIFNNETDMTFTYLSVDLLARMNLGSLPLYLLFGPSYSSLSSNEVKLDQTILQPDDLYYWEDANGSITNMLRSGSSEGEIIEILDSRWDLKFGLGYWLQIAPKLSLTPEVAVAVPLGKLIDEDQLDADAIEAGLVNTDFNMITTFITIGLRWHID
jgi:hypothetical protein